MSPGRARLEEAATAARKAFFNRLAGGGRRPRNQYAADRRARHATQMLLGMIGDSDPKHVAAAKSAAANRQGVGHR
ncbi:MAG: hypothetical protein WKF84_26810 [Pyrinomonadaceae bacterium]